MQSTEVSDNIQRAYDRYVDGRDELRKLAPCQKCCPPRGCCCRGEYIVGCEIRLCGKCHGNGFWINWEDDE